MTGKIRLTVFVSLVVLIAVFVFASRELFSTSKLLPTDTQNESPIKLVTLVGNLTHSDQEPESNSWNLVYEKPGSPALITKLELNHAQCQSSGVVVDCKVILKIGNRVSITGEERNSLFIVKNIALLNEERKQALLYFYNPNIDKDQSGNILCSEKGLTPVTRDINESDYHLASVLNLLISGSITEAEKATGLTTEFPLSGLQLLSATLSGTDLLLTFEDLSHKSSGGSCRISILRAQIEATARQFPEVKAVKFAPDEVFQP